MKILVLGGTYFIGRWLVHCLLRLGHSDITLLNRGTRKHELPKGTMLIQADRSSVSSIKHALDGDKSYDMVFDLSGYTKQDVEIVVCALRNRIGQYVFCSSAAVYKQPPGYWPFTEDHPLCSITDNSYGYNKWQAENFLFCKHQEGALKAIVVRPVYVYGPYNYRMRESVILERASFGLPIAISGTGENLIQFGYVQDLADAMIKAAGNSKFFGQAFNVSGYELVTVRGFIEKIFEIVDKKVDILTNVCQKEKGALEVVPFPDVHRFSDISKAANFLGIKPQTNLNQGLTQTYEIWQKERCKT